MCKAIDSVINVLASKGYCRALLPRNTSPSSLFGRGLRSRTCACIHTHVCTLRIRAYRILYRQREIIHLGRDTDMLLVKVLFSRAFGIRKATARTLSPSAPHLKLRRVVRLHYCGCKIIFLWRGPRTNPGAGAPWNAEFWATFFSLSSFGFLFFKGEPRLTDAKIRVRVVSLFRNLGGRRRAEGSFWEIARVWW